MQWMSTQASCLRRTRLRNQMKERTTARCACALQAQRGGTNGARAAIAVATGGDRMTHMHVQMQPCDAERGAQIETHEERDHCGGPRGSCACTQSYYDYRDAVERNVQTSWMSVVEREACTMTTQERVCVRDECYTHRGRRRRRIRDCL